MHRYVTIPTEGMATATAYRLVCGAVAPRPVAWITTLGADGRVNAAPFSAYNYVAHTPPMLGVSIASRLGELKDTARNIRASGHFVVNVATQDTMDDTSAESGQGEFEGGGECLGGLCTRLVRIGGLRREFAEGLGDFQHGEVLQEVHQEVPFGIGRDEDHRWQSPSASRVWMLTRSSAPRGSSVKMTIGSLMPPA